MMNQPPQRPTPPPCPRCQGQCVWAEVGMTGSQGFRLIYARKKPGALFFGEKGVDMVATICLNCGHAAFYAKGVLKVRDDFENHPEWFNI